MTIQDGPNTWDDDVRQDGVLSSGSQSNPNHINGGEARTAHTKRTASVPLRDVPAYTPMRKLKIVTIGAGFSGLLFAHKLQHQYAEMQNLVEHKIIESREEIGGTWLVNTYPGIQCDVPAHIYVRCSKLIFMRAYSFHDRHFLSILIQTGVISTHRVGKYMTTLLRL